MKLEVLIKNEMVRMFRAESTQYKINCTRQRNLLQLKAQKTGK